MAFFSGALRLRLGVLVGYILNHSDGQLDELVEIREIL